MSIIQTAKQEMQKRYEELEVELSALEMKTLNVKYRSLEARDAAAKSLRENIQSLKQKVAAARHKIGEFPDENAGAWTTFREGMESAWDNLRSCCSASYEEFNKAYAEDDDKLDKSDPACSSTTDGTATTASPSTAASGQCSPEARTASSK
jgi:predicted  nucleic acid-binding Zn-ribbon protein